MSRHVVARAIGSPPKLASIGETMTTTKNNARSIGITQIATLTFVLYGRSSQHLFWGIGRIYRVKQVSQSGLCLWLDLDPKLLTDHFKLNRFIGIIQIAILVFGVLEGSIVIGASTACCS